MDSETKKFGRRLAALREAANFASPADFARHLGVAKQTAYNWEKRETPPPPSKLDKIAKGLKMTVQELLDSGSNKTGRAEAVSEPASNYGKAPSTRKDCEDYASQIFDAAEQSGDPDAFPHVMRVLKETHLLEKFESERPKSKAEEIREVAIELEKIRAENLKRHQARAQQERKQEPA